MRSVKTEPVVDVDAASNDSEIEILSGRPPVSQLSSFFPLTPTSFPQHAPTPQADPPSSQSKKGKSVSSTKVTAGTFSSHVLLTYSTFFSPKVSSHSNDDDGPEEKAQSSFLFHYTGPSLIIAIV